MRRPVAAFGLLLFGSTSFASGVEISAEYTADILSVVSGGLSAGTEYLDNFVLVLEIDMAEVWNSGTGRIQVRGLYNNGSTFSADRVGDLQVVSNIDADEDWRLFEIWYELAGTSWSVRTGLYDLNSEFDVNETGSIFLNSSHGIGAEFAQTGENGPSIFPVTSLAIRAAMTVGPLTARGAVFDGVPGDPSDPTNNRIELSGREGALAVSEFDVPYANSARFWLGYWRYSAEFDRIDGSGSDHGNDGWYVGTEAGFQLGSRAAKGFLRYGRADERFNVLSSYLGVGAVIAGPFVARPRDQVGIAVASARAGDAFLDHTASIGGRAIRHETTWELAYQFRVNEYVVIRPDIQYVRNPSLSPDLDSAWVVGCRIQLGN